MPGRVRPATERTRASTAGPSVFASVSDLLLWDPLEMGRQLGVGICGLRCMFMLVRSSSFSIGLWNAVFSLEIRV